MNYKKNSAPSGAEIFISSIHGCGVIVRRDAVAILTVEVDPAGERLPRIFLLVDTVRAVGIVGNDRVRYAGFRKLQNLFGKAAADRLERDTDVFAEIDRIVHVEAVHGAGTVLL